MNSFETSEFLKRILKNNWVPAITFTWLPPQRYKWGLTNKTEGSVSGFSVHWMSLRACFPREAKIWGIICGNSLFFNQHIRIFATVGSSAHCYTMYFDTSRKFYGRSWGTFSLEEKLMWFWFMGFVNIHEYALCISRTHRKNGGL